MKKYIKLLCCILLTLGVLIPPFHCAFASETTTNYKAIIDDDYDLLTPEEEEDLYEEMSKLLEYGNMAFTTVWLDSSTNYETHAESTYYDWFGNEPGVLFQIDMGNRKLTISASTGMEELIGSERDSIVDNIYTYATDGDYYTCAYKCFHQIYNYLHGGQIAHTMKYIDNAILALILALILNYIIIFAGSRKKVSAKAILGATVLATSITASEVIKGRKTKYYSPAPKSSSGGGSSGGGGGGGGGGFSGGSSSHGF